jgi:putative Holliday junction resolvase
VSRVLIGIDFGLKRIGLAEAPGVGDMTFPLDVLENQEGIIDRIAAIAREKGADALVVGMPFHMDGQESDMAGHARTFGHRLAESTGLPVHYVDERLTSSESTQRLRDAGLSEKEQRGKKDAVAAQVILETYLRQSTA